MSGDPERAARLERRERLERLERLEMALGHRFRDRMLLETALRHSSYAHELALESKPAATSVGKPAERSATNEVGGGRGRESNERLEFLGDAVVALVVAEALYAAKPDWREGDLTRSLHAIVEGRSLSELARSLDVGAVLQLGRTEQSSDGRDKDSILENAMEALIGAMFLDAGLEPVERFVRQAFGDVLAADAVRVERDPKTELQETLMATRGEFPVYALVCDSRIEGDEERFTVEVVSKGDALARGVGRTKRAAEKNAARRALEQQGSAEPTKP